MQVYLYEGLPATPGQAKTYTFEIKTQAKNVYSANLQEVDASTLAEGIFELKLLNNAKIIATEVAGTFSLVRRFL